MSFDEIYETLASERGNYVRCTWPNGVRRSGLIGAWRDYLTFAGHLVGGEFATVMKIEARQPNGRYTEIEVVS